MIWLATRVMFYYCTGYVSLLHSALNMPTVACELWYVNTAMSTLLCSELLYTTTALFWVTLHYYCSALLPILCQLLSASV